LFCYQVKKAISALAATIGGLETLVFSGGIGEHSPEIRARALEGLEYLGIVGDAERNQANAPIISADASACTVRVIATDEESILLREALAALDPAWDVRAKKGG
jgi:acetate kinase